MGSLFSSFWSQDQAQAPQGGSETALVFLEAGEKIHHRACFGAGCYWGTEKFFKINFARKMYPESMIKNTFVGK
jgi:hypothetical protein